MNPQAKDTKSAQSPRFEPNLDAEDRRQLPSVAIVGGGIAGLTAARELSEAGLSVHVFDKGRGPGGRASTRREGTRRFDHGAQYFTTRSDRFQRQVNQWVQEGAAAEWRGRIAVLDGDQVSFKQEQVERFVGVPGMNAIVKRLAEGTSISFGVRVDRLEQEGGQWSLLDPAGKHIATSSLLLLALPPEQALSLLEEVQSPLAVRVRPVRSDPCWAVLASFEKRLGVTFDGAFLERSPLAWVARDSSKPGREPGERWVLHAAADWSVTHLEQTADEVANELLRTFFEATRVPPESPEFLGAHRWRFAKAEQALADGCLWDEESNLGVCGDWCHESRVEGAFLSGFALAERVLADVGKRRATER